MPTGSEKMPLESEKRQEEVIKQRALELHELSKQKTVGLEQLAKERALINSLLCKISGLTQQSSRDNILESIDQQLVSREFLEAIKGKIGELNSEDGATYNRFKAELAADVSDKYQNLKNFVNNPDMFKVTDQDKERKCFPWTWTGMFTSASYVHSSGRGASVSASAYADADDKMFAPTDMPIEVSLVDYIPLDTLASSRDSLVPNAYSIKKELRSYQVVLPKEPFNHLVSGYHFERFLYPNLLSPSSVLSYPYERDISYKFFPEDSLDEAVHDSSSASLGAPLNLVTMRKILFENPEVVLSGSELIMSTQTFLMIQNYFKSNPLRAEHPVTQSLIDNFAVSLGSSEGIQGIIRIPLNPEKKEFLEDINYALSDPKSSLLFPANKELTALKSALPSAEPTLITDAAASVMTGSSVISKAKESGGKEEKPKVRKKKAVSELNKIEWNWWQRNVIGVGPLIEDINKNPTEDAITRFIDLCDQNILLDRDDIENKPYEDAVSLLNELKTIIVNEVSLGGGHKSKSPNKSEKSGSNIGLAAKAAGLVAFASCLSNYGSNISGNSFGQSLVLSDTLSNTLTCPAYQSVKVSPTLATTPADFSTSLVLSNTLTRPAYTISSALAITSTPYFDQGMSSPYSHLLFDSVYSTSNIVGTSSLLSPPDKSFSILSNQPFIADGLTLIKDANQISLSQAAFETLKNALSRNERGMQALNQEDALIVHELLFNSEYSLDKVSVISNAVKELFTKILKESPVNKDWMESSRDLILDSGPAIEKSGSSNSWISAADIFSAGVDPYTEISSNTIHAKPVSSHKKTQKPTSSPRLSDESKKSKGWLTKVGVLGLISASFFSKYDPVTSSGNSFGKSLVLSDTLSNTLTCSAYQLVTVSPLDMDKNVCSPYSYVSKLPSLYAVGIPGSAFSPDYASSGNGLTSLGMSWDDFPGKGIGPYNIFQETDEVTEKFSSINVPKAADALTAREQTTSEGHNLGAEAFERYYPTDDTISGIQTEIAEEGHTAGSLAMTSTASFDSSSNGNPAEEQLDSGLQVRAEITTDGESAIKAGNEISQVNPYSNSRLDTCSSKDAPAGSLTLAQLPTCDLNASNASVETMSMPVTIEGQCLVDVDTCPLDTLAVSLIPPTIKDETCPVQPECSAEGYPLVEQSSVSSIKESEDSTTASMAMGFTQLIGGAMLGAAMGLETPSAEGGSAISNTTGLLEKAHTDLTSNPTHNFTIGSINNSPNGQYFNLTTNHSSSLIPTVSAKIEEHITVQATDNPARIINAIPLQTGKDSGKRLQEVFGTEQKSIQAFSSGTGKDKSPEISAKIEMDICTKEDIKHVELIIDSLNKAGVKINEEKFLKGIKVNGESLESLQSCKGEDRFDALALISKVQNANASLSSSSKKISR